MLCKHNIWKIKRNFVESLGIDFVLYLNILIIAHDNVVVVILCFMDIKEECVVPESFFQNWVGKIGTNGEKPKFSEAEGSSLTSGQLKMLIERGIPVIRVKGPEFLKVFVPCSGSTFYSAIIPRNDLKDLAQELSPWVKFSVSDQRSFGLDWFHFVRITFLGGIHHGLWS